MAYYCTHGEYGEECFTLDIYLYRLRDNDGVLLYVGITSWPDQRRVQHQADWWWDQVDEMEHEYVANDKCSAEFCKRLVIQSELPHYNIEHSPFHGNYVHPSRP